MRAQGDKKIHTFCSHQFPLSLHTNSQRRHESPPNYWDTNMPSQLHACIPVVYVSILIVRTGESLMDPLTCNYQHNDRGRARPLCHQDKLIPADMQFSKIQWKPTVTNCILILYLRSQPTRLMIRRRVSAGFAPGMMTVAGRPSPSQKKPRADQHAQQQRTARPVR